jgi:hypothetical protein
MYTNTLKVSILVQSDGDWWYVDGQVLVIELTVQRKHLLVRMRQCRSL